MVSSELKTLSFLVATYMSYGIKKVKMETMHSNTSQGGL